MDPVGFMTSIRALFPVNHQNAEDRAAWLASYTSELSGFSSDELELAAGTIKRTRNANGRENRFPSLAECLDECKDARKLFAQRKREETLPGLRDEEANLTDDERHTRKYGPGRVHVVWGTLMKTELARQAAREGWIGMLEPYCFEHGRLPDPKEFIDVKDRYGRPTGRLPALEYMKREAKGIDNWHGDGTPASRVMAKAKIIILEKRDRLARRVLEGQP